MKLFLAPALSLLLVPAGCGSSDDPTPANLPHFNDIASAAPAIQSAARAVVRVRTATSVASGAFISPTGLLLTNNHVLGADVCPVEGCSVELTFMHQRGQMHRDSIKAFAVPIAVDVGLDMTTAQIFSSGRDASGGNLATPDFLAFSVRDPSSLLGAHVTIVGHPEGHLKKWTDGIVYDSFGSWFSVNAYILPGDSGSPVLDDEGQIVGLIHRAVDSLDLISNDGVNVVAIGTASAPLTAAMSAALPPAMISTAAAATAVDVVSHDIVYLNGNAASAKVGEEQVSILSLLATACDTGLLTYDHASPDDLSKALRPCYDAMNWIECRTDQTPDPFATFCPVGPDNEAWSSRFLAVNQRWVSLYGQPDLYAVSFAMASLTPSKDDGAVAGAGSLQQNLDASQRALDFTVANYLAAFAVPTYRGVNVVDYVRGYAKAPHFELGATSIASAAGWLLNKGMMGRGEVQGILSNLAGTSSVSIGSRLYIEDFQYDSGWIQ